LLRVIDQDHRNPVVGHEIAGADVLLVSAEIGQRQRVIVDHLQKALWAASMLNVRPSGCADRRPIE